MKEFSLKKIVQELLSKKRYSKILAAELSKVENNLSNDTMTQVFY